MRKITPFILILCLAAGVILLGAYKDKQRLPHDISSAIWVIKDAGDKKAVATQIVDQWLNSQRVFQFNAVYDEDFKPFVGNPEKYIELRSKEFTKDNDSTLTRVTQFNLNYAKYVLGAFSYEQFQKSNQSFVKDYNIDMTQFALTATELPNENEFDEYVDNKIHTILLGLYEEDLTWYEILKDGGNPMDDGNDVEPEEELLCSHEDALRALKELGYIPKSAVAVNGGGEYDVIYMTINGLIIEARLMLNPNQDCGPAAVYNKKALNL